MKGEHPTPRARSQPGLFAFGRLSKGHPCKDTKKGLVRSPQEQRGQREERGLPTPSEVLFFEMWDLGRVSSPL